MIGLIWIFILNVDYLIRGIEDYNTPRRYILNLTQMTWNDAQTTCKQNGGALATLYDLSTVPDLDLNNALKESNGLFWIGLHTDINHTWVWGSGDDVIWQNWNAGVSSRADCAAVTVMPPYDWVIINCHERMPYLCQYPGGECRFREYEDFSIAGHNYMYLYQKTAEYCKDICVSSTEFVCQSFEYFHGDGRCQFNIGNRWTLPEFYSSHSGWTYFHRTCNSGEITGELLDIPASTASSSIYISPSSTIATESTNFAIECSDVFMPKGIYVTHDVVVTRFLSVTRDIPVTREIYVTRDVILTETAFVTSTITVFETSTPIITPSPSFTYRPPSTSVYVDPVEELKEIGEIVKERQKTLKKTSVDDKRPSASYVGYVAIIFLALVFGLIILFDLSSIFMSKKCCKRDTKCKKIEKLVNDEPVNEPKQWDWTRFKSKGQHSTHIEMSLITLNKLDDSKEGLDTSHSYNTGTHAIKDDKHDNATNDDTKNKTIKHNGCTYSDNRLWRNQIWSVCDSGFDGSCTISETSSNANERDHETISVDIENDGDRYKSDQFEILKYSPEIGEDNEIEHANVYTSDGHDQYDKRITHF